MNNESQICFISSPHDSFFCGKVVEFKERYHKSPDEYHKALFYCLGINCDTRRNFEISMIGKQTVLSRNV